MQFLTPSFSLSSPRKAVGMARGNINPLNHAVMDSYSPSKVGTYCSSPYMYTVQCTSPCYMICLCELAELTFLFLSPILCQAPPPKSKSRASSVMGGGAGWGKPVDPRPPTSLLTSDSSRKHFRPPKKLKSKPGIHVHVHSLLITQ